MRITGTFLDEISHDIPHQNWAESEWARDFAAMRAIGIDTVILIRCGCARFMTYPSAVLAARQGAYAPSLDLVDLFLRLAHGNGMRFYFGLYDSRHYWHIGDYDTEIDLNRAVIDEAWERYGSHPAFAGWYLSQEISRRIPGIASLYTRLGGHCKATSSGLPTLISPYMDGVKNVNSTSNAITKAAGVTIEDHVKEWDEILFGVRGAVDIVAFQDGHVEYSELGDFLAANRELAQRHGMQSWSNTESFDRDMPIKFLPIKWDKLRLKLDAAAAAGVDKVITFEFSHFMSPQSCYPQAHGLFRRYCQHAGLGPRGHAVP